MNRLDDLRRTFEAEAADLPDETGLVAGARTRAARIRRRRRLVATTAAGVVVLLAAVAVPVAVHLRSAVPPVTPARPAGSRSPWQMTLTMDPSYPIAVTYRATSASVQELTVEKYPVATTELRIDVRVDQRPLDGPGTGESLIIDGRTAWFHPGNPGTAFVEWMDAQGNRVQVVSQVPGTARADMLAAARAVRLVAPFDVPMPIRLGPIPAGLAPSDLQSFGYHPEAISRHEFGVTAGVLTLVSPAHGRDFSGVSVTVESRSTLSGTPRPDIAGHPAVAEAIPTGIGLAVQAGPCLYRFETQKVSVTEAQLRALAAGATYRDCTRPSTWIAPEG